MAADPAQPSREVEAVTVESGFGEAAVWHALPAAEVARRWETDPGPGLSETECRPAPRAVRAERVGGGGPHRLVHGPAAAVYRHPDHHPRRRRGDFARRRRCRRRGDDPRDRSAERRPRLRAGMAGGEGHGGAAPDAVAALHGQTRWTGDGDRNGGPRAGRRRHAQDRRSCAGRSPAVRDAQPQDRRSGADRRIAFGRQGPGAARS